MKEQDVLDTGKHGIEPVDSRDIPTQSEEK